MAKRKLSSTLKELNSILKEIDETARTVSGRGILDLGKQAWQELRRPKMEGPEMESNLAAEDPFEVLGLDRNCIPADVVSRYRELAFKYHPDNQKTGDVEKFKKITAAYEQICSTRGIK